MKGLVIGKLVIGCQMLDTGIPDAGYSRKQITKIETENGCVTGYGRMVTGWQVNEN